MNKKKPSAGKPAKSKFQTGSKSRGPAKDSYAAKPRGPRADKPAGDRPPRKFGDKPAFKSGPRDGDRQERSFSPKPPYARGPRSDKPAGDRPPRKFGDKPAFKSGPRDGDRQERSFSPKPPYARGPRSEKPTGDRPPRKFGDKPAFKSGPRDGDRQESSFSPKPPYARGPRSDKPTGDRPPRKFGDKPAFNRGDDGPPRKFAAKRADARASKPPFKSGPRDERGGDDRPPRKFAAKRMDARSPKPAFRGGPREDREERGFSSKPSFKGGPKKDGAQRASRDSFRPVVNKPEFEGEGAPRVLRPKIATQNPARSPRQKREEREHDPQKTLERVLSKAGLGSRTEARSWIGAGRVKVNGKLIQTPDVWVDIGRDKVTLDGKPVMVDGKENRYILLYKPKGFLTTLKDPEGRPTVYDLLKDVTQFVVPVGRLDLDSTGLLMLTNDTKFADFITSPESHLPKTYMVKVSKRLTDEQLEQLRNGVELLDGMTRPAIVLRIRDTEKYTFLDITITEGRNRQVRRMIEFLDAKVLKLVRTSIGPIAIGDLEIGTWRELSEYELRALRNRTDI